MRRRIGQIVMCVFALVLVIAAAGCGGKKNSNTTTTTTTTTTQASTTPATTSSTTSASTTTSSSSLGSLGSASNCQELTSLSTEFSQAFSGANGNVQKEADTLKAFADKTPASIRPDFETLADDMEKIASAVKGIKPGSTPSPSQLASLSQLSSQIDESKLAAASTAIATWAATNCKA